MSGPCYKKVTHMFTVVIYNYAIMIATDWFLINTMMMTDRCLNQT